MGRLGILVAIAAALLAVGWVMRHDPLPEAVDLGATAERTDRPAATAEILYAAADATVAAVSDAGPAATNGRSATAPSRWGPTVREYLDSGPTEYCFDIVFVGDGYRACDLEDGTYWKDVERHASYLLKQVPFCWYTGSINVRAVFLRSETDGCDIALDRDRVNTALDSAFDESKGRMLVVRNMEALRDAIRPAGDAQAILVMVNTKFYGGAAAPHTVEIPGARLRVAAFSPRTDDSEMVAVHEVGHVVGRLADEYEDPGDEATHWMPRAGLDLPEMNVQVAGCLDRTSRETLAKTAKWGHLLALPGAEGHAWAHEGGYYRGRGVWRPWRTCRMRSHHAPFCPVCCESISKAIVGATGASWDDAAYHTAHPLSLWTE